MSYRHWALAALVLAACSDADHETLGPAPTDPFVEAPSTPIPPQSKAPGRDRHERFARRFATALRDPAFRSQVHDAIAASPDREGKVHLQAYLTRDGGREGSAFARLAGEPETAIKADLDEGDAIEFYLPVKEHRTRWAGDAQILVATAETDSDSPVAFDLMGGRRVLSGKNPPVTPVLMVSRAEKAWGAGPSGITCVFNCGGGGGGGGTTAPGLYLTQTKFRDNFEGWFKGDPEFEIHIIGPDAPGSDKGVTYQCIGQNAGAPYNWDQNPDAWTGNQLLFSQVQLDNYRAVHGNDGFRVFVIEDDDGACQIKVDENRISKLFADLKIVYGTQTAAKDTTTSVSLKSLIRARTLIALFKSAYSFFVTNDDPMGNAVADAQAASAYFPGANWLVRGEDGVSNGGLQLIMR